MKSMIISTLFVLASVTAQAKEVSSSKVSISPSSVDQLIELVNKKSQDSSELKVSILVTDSGMSTDVSPRYSVYLGFASLAEMGNIRADFLINDQTIRFLSATRIKAGVYQVKTLESREAGMFEVTQTIDATQMFIDEKNLRKACEANGDFCDGDLETKIKVTETVVAK